jgi:hypothetical protein
MRGPLGASALAGAGLPGGEALGLGVGLGLVVGAGEGEDTGEGDAEGAGDGLPAGVGHPGLQVVALGQLQYLNTGSKIRPGGQAVMLAALLKHLTKVAQEASKGLA